MKIVSDKHSSLLHQRVPCTAKKIYNVGPESALDGAAWAVRRDEEDAAAGLPRVRRKRESDSDLIRRQPYSVYQVLMVNPLRHFSYN